MRFVFEYERDEQTMTELCSSFGVSRESGYVWLRRYRQYGLEGLLEVEPGSAASSQPDAGGRSRAVLELRQAHMRGVRAS